MNRVYLKGDIKSEIEKDKFDIYTYSNNVYIILIF